ncbi:MAG: pyruvate formate lyase family protein [Actinomycetota bacterium]|nr:pyruvate formate lyase family protein [Actinomycetota bacterium]
MNRLTTRERHRFHISDEERRELMEDILPFWKGRTVRERKIALWKEKGIYETTLLGPASLCRIVKGIGLKNAARLCKLTMGGSIRNASKLPSMARELAGLRPNLALTVFYVQGHLVLGYCRVLELGMEGIAEWATWELRDLDPVCEGYENRADFLASVEVAAGAVCEYSNRYADLAGEMAWDVEGGEEAGATGDRGEVPAGAGETSTQLPAGPAVHLDDPGGHVYKLRHGRDTIHG